MAETKNICRKIFLDLHEKVRAELEYTIYWAVIDSVKGL